MKKVSIIIPIYNGEKYINECLQSVCNQNYKNIEIIIVNDGSIDSSLTICRDWQKKDSRIIIFNNENHGVSYSRNFGIEKSTGEYLAFIDADDIISFDYILTLVEMIEKNPLYDCSIVSVGAFSKRLKPFSNGRMNRLSTYETHSALYSYLGGFIAGKLYKSGILKTNKLKLDENIAVCEDLLFNVQYLRHCREIVYNTGVKYLYRQHESSAIHNIYNLKWFDCLKAYELIIQEYEEKKELLLIVVYNYLKMLCEAKYRAKFLKEKVLVKNAKNEIKCYQKYRKEFSIKQNIKLIILKYFYPIVVFYRKIRKEK